MLNPTQEDITLYKGTTLGYFQMSDSNFDSIDLGTMHEACAVQAISPNDKTVPSDEVRDETDPPNVDLSNTDLNKPSCGMPMSPDKTPAKSDLPRTGIG